MTDVGRRRESILCSNARRSLILICAQKSQFQSNEGMMLFSLFERWVPLWGVNTYYKIYGCYWNNLSGVRVPNPLCPWEPQTLDILMLMEIPDSTSVRLLILPLRQGPMGWKWLSQVPEWPDQSWQPWRGSFPTQPRKRQIQWGVCCGGHGVT